MWEAGHSSAFVTTTRSGPAASTQDVDPRARLHFDDSADEVRSDRQLSPTTVAERREPNASRSTMVLSTLR